MKKKQLLCFLASQKILKRMLLAGMLALPMSASTIYATSYPSLFEQQVTINLSFKNEKIAVILDEISKQSRIKLVYSNEQIPTNKRISIKIQTTDIKEALTAVLGNDYTFRQIDNYISISKKKKETPQTQQQKQTSTSAVKGTIKGTVIDDLGEPLPGATITVVGTPRGVATDIDGTFSIEVLPSNQLSVAYLGMETQIIKVGDKKLFSIKLMPKVDELDEVTVVAFAKQKKESVVASVTTIKPAELKVPSSNLTTALAGRLAGIISYQLSGEPGKDNAQFFVRGVTTFGEAAKNPLILIDGIEMSTDDLSRLQTDDIASFSVMKDATAAALYGSRGANGVILVTTKQGVEGKAKISVRYEVSSSSPTRTVDLADPITYMKLHNEAVRTRNPLGVLPYSEEKIANTSKGLNPQAYPCVDWMDMLFKNQAINQRVNFNISGGGTVARYYLAASYSKDTGLLKVNGKNNFNNNIDLGKLVIRATTNINMTKSTEVVVRMYGTFDDYTGPIEGGGKFYEKVMNTNQVMFQPVYQTDKLHANAPNILFGNAGTNAPEYTNPYADMVKGYKDYSTTTMLAQLEVKQNLNFITEGLNARLLMNTNRYSYFDLTRQYEPYFYRLSGYDKMADTYTLTSLNKGSEALQYKEGEKTVNTTYYFEGAVDYNRTFAEKHTLSGLLVGTIREYKQGNAGSLLLSLPHRNIGLAGRATYSFDSRYFLEGNFGYNGSERFSTKHRWGFFPSIGAGYILTNEKFFPENWKKVVHKLKFKGTYGLVGNDAIGRSQDRFFYLSDVNVKDGGKNISFGTDFTYSHKDGGVSINRYANEDISWETAYKTDLGIEIGLFDKIEILADYFKERRTNILMERAHVPSFIGLQQKPFANIGEAQSHGFDASIDYNDSFSNGMWLQGRFNFTYATSKYIIYEEPSFDDTPWRRHVGRSLGQAYGFIAERLFVDEEDVRNSPTQNFDSQKTMAGDIKYKDLNGDGQITESDQAPIGYPTSPEIIYGFGFSAGYKGFDLSCFFQGSARSSFWIDPAATAPFIGNQRALMQVYADDHWSEDNRNSYALWPRLSADARANNNQASTWFMRDGSFLRLKSVEMGYTLPKKLTQKAHIGMVRLYASGTNLLTFSKFKLWDVEMGGSGLGYPVQLVINAGILLNF